MNPCFVSCIPCVAQESDKQVTESWASGKTFKLYTAGPVSKADSDRLLRAGFTHVYVIWQDAEHRVHKTEIDIVQHMDRH